MKNTLRLLRRYRSTAWLFSPFPPALKAWFKQRIENPAWRWAPLSPNATPAERSARYWAERWSAVALSQFGLRNHSSAVREPLAIRVSYGKWNYAELAERFRTDAGIASLQPKDVELNELLHLARLISSHPVDPDDAELSWRMLQFATRDGFGQTEHQTLPFAVATYLERGLAADVRIAMDKLAFSPQLRNQLSVDLLNPWQENAANQDEQRWLDTLNAEYRKAGIAPIELLPAGESVFDRLTATAPSRITDGPLVSIVTCTHRPDWQLATSVRSVLAQSWQNWELLIVDDASGDEFAPVLDEVAAMDPRIRVLRLTENGGAYRARNEAMRHINGEFVTFHDDDDWMHPQRIEIQVQHLIKNPQYPANTSQYRRMLPNGFLSYGRRLRLLGISEVSIMFRPAQVLPVVGGFDPVRKGGDTEFRLRVGAAFGIAVPTLRNYPGLMLGRFDPASLSGSEFGDEWAHEARRLYWASAHAYHSSIAAGTRSPFVGPNPEDRQCPIPGRFLGQPNRVLDVDDVILIPGVPEGEQADLRAELALIASLRTQGRRVGVSLVVTPSYPHIRGKLPEQLHEPILNGSIALVPLTERGQAARLWSLVPEAVQFLTDDPLQYSFSEAVIVAAPGTEQTTWDRSTVAANLHRQFSIDAARVHVVSDVTAAPAPGE